MVIMVKVIMDYQYFITSTLVDIDLRVFQRGGRVMSRLCFFNSALSKVYSPKKVKLHQLPTLFKFFLKVFQKFFYTLV